MIAENYFFAIFLSTILITRIFLYFHPTPAPTILGFRTHHYMYGLVLAPVGLVIGNIVAFAVGMGLFFDELSYLLIGGKTHKDNYSIISLTGTVFFTIIVFLLRKYLVYYF